MSSFQPHRILTLAPLLALLLFSTNPSHADSCDPIRTFADNKSPNREIFISPSGSNSNGDGSRSNPFQTIPRALQGIKPGDALRLLPGEYPGGAFIADISGTENAPIWIGGEPGQPRPVIRGGSNALHLSRVRFLVIENLEITGATANGINCDDGADYANPNATRHLLFRNLAFSNVGTGGNNDALKLSGVYDYYVLDSEFQRISAGGSGIDHVGCHRGLIARCSFTDMGNSIQCKGGSEDIEIRWNRFSNGGARAINIGGSTGFTFFRPPLSTTEPNFESKNIRVFANLFRGSDAPVAFVGTVNSIVAHNTIVNPTRWIIRILQETTSTDTHTFLPSGHNQFINNIVYFDRSRISTFVNIGANTDAPSFEFANNLWYASNQPSQSQPALPSPEANGLHRLDPQFRNAAEGDFSLPSESPAAGKGLHLLAPKADLAERCYANPPTIGAFEANPPPTARTDSDGDLMPDDWEDEHALNKLDPADAQLDPDADRLTNYGEFLANTDPHNPASHFALEVTDGGGTAFALRYPTVSNRTYHLEFTDLFASNTWSPRAIVPGTGDHLTLSEQPTAPAKFFRIKIAASSESE